MSAHTYKLVELVGSSPTSTDEAIRNAVHEGVGDGEAHRLVPGDRDARPRRERQGRAFPGHAEGRLPYRRLGSRLEPQSELAERLECRERRRSRLHELAQRVGVLDDRLLPRRRRTVERRPADWFRIARADRPSAHLRIERDADARAVDRADGEARLAELGVERRDDVARDRVGRRSGCATCRS